MGGGSYNVTSRSTRATSLGYNQVSANTLHTVMPQAKLRRIHSLLDPKGVDIRESRDSIEHPLSLAIMLCLDFTASMGEIPAMLISKGLPETITKLFENGIEHPQVSFVGIGDHECDSYPLQIGQFESSDQALDTDLTNMYPERGGGGNAGESYLLAWYHAVYHTDIDCFNKRGQKGVLLTIGDENTLLNVFKDNIINLYGVNKGQKDKYTAKELYIAASEKYHVYHINTSSTYSGRATKNNPSKWKDIVGENFRNVEDASAIPDELIKIVTGCLSNTHITNLTPVTEEPQIVIETSILDDSLTDDNFIK